MLGWSITFLIIALVAALLGFGGIATLSANVAQVLFGVFILLFIVAAIIHVVQGKKPPV